MLTKRLFLLILLLALVFPVNRAAAAATAGPDFDALHAYLRAQVQANRMPGLAAAVIYQGQVAFVRGYGVDPDAQFVIGSTTKSYTALAVMQLVEQGKLALDAPVQRYLPWFAVADPQASAAITVRHLLHQTTGLDAPLDPGSEKFFPTLEQQVRELRDARSIAEPGAEFHYYNQNYRVLGLLIEQASGQAYADYLREHIFQPLGMTDTVADPAEASHMAPAYTQVFSFPVRASQPFHADALPSGYLISTAADSARYLGALMAGGALDGQRIARPETVQALFTPPAGIGSNYAMGWMVLDDPELGGKAYFHSGALDSYASQYLMIPGKELGLVLLYNQNSLFTMMTLQEPLMAGAVGLLLGDSTAQGGTVWPGMALGGIALLDAMNHLRLYASLPRWAAKARRQGFWRYVVIAWEVGFAIFVLLAAPGLIAGALGESGGWADMFTVMPDLVIWMVGGSLLVLARGLARAGLLLRGGSHASVLAARRA